LANARYAQAARLAYDNLDYGLKPRVSNYDDLLAALAEREPARQADINPVKKL